MHLFPDQCLAVLTDSDRKSRSRDECLSEYQVASSRIHLALGILEPRQFEVCSPHGASGAPWGILRMSVSPYCGTKIYRMAVMLSVYASARFSGCDFSSTGRNRSFRACASCPWRDLKRETRAGAGIATSHPRFLRAIPPITFNRPSPTRDPLNTTDLHAAKFSQFCLMLTRIPWPRTIGHGRQAFDSPSLSVGC